MHLQFTKRVGKTIASGRVTLPKECEHLLTAMEYCPLGNSLAINFILKDAFQIQGRLYQSSNNTTTYYQFYIPNRKEGKMFSDQVKSEKEISFDFDPAQKTLAACTLGKTLHLAQHLP